MKQPKKLLQIVMLSIVILMTNSCKKDKKDDEDLNPLQRTVIVICDQLNETTNYRLTLASINLNQGFASVFKTEAEAGEGTTFNLTESSVSYSYNVTERFGTISSSVTKTYSGTLNESAFVKNQKNKIDIIRKGAEWELLINGKKEDNGPPPVVATGPSGRWQRYGSPKGYQTDLAIGNIPGQDADRVYMCEHPGSPSAGLYKGRISGNTITWDAVHNLPNAVFDLLGSGPDRTLYYGVGLKEDAGKYKKGIWTDTCPM